MLRVKVFKLNKNVEETSTSSTNKVEEKCHRLLEGKNKEKHKIYAEVIKGSVKKEEYNPLKKNVPKVQKAKKEDYRRDGHQRRPSTFKQPRIFTLNEGVNGREYRDQPKNDFRRTTPQRKSFTPRYVNFFYGHCFYCTNYYHMKLSRFVCVCCLYPSLYPCLISLCLSSAPPSPRIFSYD